MSHPPVHVPSLKVAELKEELSKRGLETKGLKKDLADRLQKAQDLDASGGTELAPPGQDAKAQALPPKELAQATSNSEPVLKEDGVGHAMVEGALERAEEIHEQAKEQVDSSKEVDLQPSALDTEVAEVVMEEEVKDALPSTPSPPRAISPAPPSKTATPARGPTPPAPPAHPAQPAPTQPAEVKNKRERTEEPAPSSPPKRPRTDAKDVPLPQSLSHLHHPPTAVLYITNLRRPLLLPTLHDYISPSGSSNSPLPPPRAPFSSDAHPNVWLSGVKSHAYAYFDSVDDALQVAERIEGVTWPEVTGAQLHVEFVPEDKVRDLVEREESAWSNARQQLNLDIRQVGQEWEFDLVGSRPGGARPGAGPGRLGGPPPIPLGARPDAAAGVARNGLGRLPPRPVLSGANAVGPGGRIPPAAPRGRMSPPLGRNGPGRDGRGGFGPRDRFPGAERRTYARPCLTWREGPGARR